MLLFDTFSSLFLQFWKHLWLYQFWLHKMSPFHWEPDIGWFFGFQGCFQWRFRPFAAAFIILSLTFCIGTGSSLRICSFDIHFFAAPRPPFPLLRFPGSRSFFKAAIISFRRLGNLGLRPRFERCLVEVIEKSISFWERKVQKKCHFFDVHTPEPSTLSLRRLKKKRAEAGWGRAQGYTEYAKMQDTQGGIDRAPFLFIL